MRFSYLKNTLRLLLRFIKCQLSSFSSLRAHNGVATDRAANESHLHCQESCSGQSNWLKTDRPHLGNRLSIPPRIPQGPDRGFPVDTDEGNTRQELRSIFQT